MLGLEQPGWLTPFVELMCGERIRRYVQMELDGLTRSPRPYGDAT